MRDYSWMFGIVAILLWTFFGSIIWADSLINMGEQPIGEIQEFFFNLVWYLRSIL